MRTCGVLALLLGIFAASTALGQPQAIPVARERLGVVIVADGSGDCTDVSEHLSLIFREHRLPLAVYALRWSRWKLPVKDHKDFDGQLQGGRRLANYVKNYRAAFPQEKIYLVGYSSGTHVVLAAAERLPANSVDRIVLMASTVSFNYDLYPAVRCVRRSVDHFYSKEDQVVINVAEECGTADRRFVRAAGERGFSGRADALVSQKLRQYCWQPSIAWTGHHGDHAGFTCMGFLEACVTPLFRD